jgi:hypothetical protein
VSELLHQPVAAFDLTTVPVLNNVALSNQALLLELSAGLRYTDLPTSTLPKFDPLLNSLGKGVISLHLVLKVGTRTRKFMWVFIFYHDWHSFFVY